jgi:tetratricopeptide (TPR) repeat protein
MEFNNTKIYSIGSGKDKMRFDVWGKRLVWNEAEQMATTAIQETVRQTVESSVTELNVDSLVRNAQDKIQGDDEKAKAAKDLIRQKGNEFQQVIDFIKGRSAYNIAYEALDPGALKTENDFKTAATTLTDLETKYYNLSSLNFGASLPKPLDKRTQVSTAALNYYKGLAEQSHIGEKPGHEDMQKTMALAGELQQKKDGGEMYLLDDAQKQEVRDKYGARILVLLHVLKQNQDKMSEDEVASLKRFDFAISNLNAAEQGKEEGHLSGAKEYMTMVVAEQEARRVWMQLPGSGKAGDTSNWRPNEQPIVNPLTADNKEYGADSPNRTLYNQAVQAFNEALVMTSTGGVEGKVQYGKATARFQEATALFQKLLEMANAEKKPEQDKELVAAKEKADKAKAAFEASGDPYEARIAVVKSLVDALPVDDKVVSKETVIVNLKEIERIYSKALQALSQERSAWVDIEAYRKSGGTIDQTANVIWQNAETAFNSGNFDEAARMFEEVKKLYSHMVEKPGDRVYSMAVDPQTGELRKYSEQENKEAKQLAENLLQAAPDLEALTKPLLIDAEFAARKGYYAHSVVQYREIQRVCNLAEAAKKTKNQLPDNETQVSSELRMQGDRYYQLGNFEKANDYYLKAKTAASNDSVKPSILQS